MELSLRLEVKVHTLIVQANSHLSSLISHLSSLIHNITVPQALQQSALPVLGYMCVDGVSNRGLLNDR